MRLSFTKLSFAVLSCAVAISTAACEKDGNTGPSPTVVDLHVAGTTSLLISQSSTFTATAVYSNNTSGVETPTWTSSAAEVASILPSGQVTALRGGTTTITAAMDGVTATLELKVTNPLPGRWLLAAAAIPGSPSGIGTRVKEFTDTQWVITQPNPNGGPPVFHHGGRYTLRGTEYIETVEFANASTASFIGRTFTLQVNLGTDSYMQLGAFTEEWRRIP